MCPRCGSSETGRRGRRTSIGYPTFGCRACRSVFNERTGTPFNELQYPTDVVLLAVLWRLRYKLSLPRRRQDPAPARLRGDPRNGP
jgi:transposase-like protein